MTDSEELSSKTINSTVKTVGNLLVPTIKSVGDPVLKVVLAIVGTIDIFTFVLIACLIFKSTEYGTISLVAFMVCNFVVVVILVLRFKAQQAIVRSVKSNYDLKYHENPA